MSNVDKDLRADDTDIRKLNHLGLSLKAIGKELGCHGVTVSTRLREMGLEPSDTRKSFMEGVYNALSPEERTWLADGLYNKGMHVRDFVVALLKEAYANRPPELVPEAPQMPELRTVDSDPEDRAVTDVMVINQELRTIPLEDLFEEG